MHPRKLRPPVGVGGPPRGARGAGARTLRQQRPRPARAVICVCLLLQYLIQSCARGGRRIVEDMCYEIHDDHLGTEKV
jgi:hypothetical protein